MKSIVHWIEQDRMKLGNLDREITGTVRRIDIPIHSDLQIRRAGELLQNLGRELQAISRFHWGERRILLEAVMKISASREALKAKSVNARGQSISSFNDDRPGMWLFCLTSLITLQGSLVVRHNVYNKKPGRLTPYLASINDHVLNGNRQLKSLVEGCFFTLIMAVILTAGLIYPT